MPSTIAWKTQGNPNIASARYRALLPCRYLRQAGWACEMYDDARAERYGLVVFQKVYDDDALALVRSLKERGVKTVFDLCDNLFHYDLDNPPAQEKRKQQLKRMLEAVDAVSVSTPPLIEIIRDAAGRTPVVSDDVVEEPRINPLAKSYYRLKNYFESARPRPFRVVWYGIAGAKNPPYGMIDLPRVLPALSRLHEEIPLSLTVISNSPELFREYTEGATFPTRYREWNAATFPYVFSGHDVCIIPVNSNPLTMCKTNNRLVLSLLLGVPVVADRMPSYEEFGDFVLFSDWQRHLRAYALDPDLRRRHVERGQSYIRSVYNRGRAVTQWSSLFQSLMG